MRFRNIRITAGVVWGGVGWDNNVHVPVHTGTATGSCFSSSVTAGVGWGGVGWGEIITFMFQYTHTHTGTGTGSGLSSSVTAGAGCDGVGWDNNVHVPVQAQTRQQALVFHHQLLLGWGGVG